MRTPNRIVLVDNQPAGSADFRAALEEQPDLRLVATVACASRSFAAVSQHSPDLVVLHLSMPEHRVLELVNDLCVLHAGLKLLLVCSHGQDFESGRVLRAGAHGCVSSGSSIAARLEAVRQVLAGGHSFSPPPPLPPFQWTGTVAPALQRAS